jgi:hypothetical protein
MNCKELAFSREKPPNFGFGKNSAHACLKQRHTRFVYERAFTSNDLLTPIIMPLKDKALFLVF